MKNARIAAAAAGLLCVAAAAHAGSAGIGFGAGQSLDAGEFLAEARAGASAAAPAAPAAGEPGRAVEWVSVGGGTFPMGTEDGVAWFGNAKPVHEVAVGAFEMSKTLVTVEQYEECVIQGACTAPGTEAGPDGYCNWGKADRRRHPVNCVDWDQANRYARFKGARLPSESEYEYAAKSGGRARKYPWGDDKPDCGKAVMYDGGGYGCGGGKTLPVCSRPAGNAKVSGGELCDMVGDVWQWVQDKYQGSYDGAPADGSAFEAAGSQRVVRGGAFDDLLARDLRADRRGHDVPAARSDGIGFRLARSSR